MRQALKRALVEDAAEHMSAEPLAALREKIAKVLDIDDQITDLEERLAQLNRDRWAIVGHFNVTGELVSLMQSVGVPEFTVEARGNHPAYVAKLTNMITAKLPDDDRRERALRVVKWLAGLAKIQFSVDFAKGQRRQAKKFETLLKKSGVADYSMKYGVHSGTLTAEIRRRISDGTPPSPAEMDLLGAAVFPTVKLTEKKELRTNVKGKRKEEAGSY